MRNGSICSSDFLMRFSSRALFQDTQGVGLNQIHVHKRNVVHQNHIVFLVSIYKTVESAMKTRTQIAPIAKTTQVISNREIHWSVHTFAGAIDRDGVDTRVNIGHRHHNLVRTVILARHIDHRPHRRAEWWECIPDSCKLSPVEHETRRRCHESRRNVFFPARVAHAVGITTDWGLVEARTWGNPTRSRVLQIDGCGHADVCKLQRCGLCVALRWRYTTRLQLDKDKREACIEHGCVCGAVIRIHASDMHVRL